MINELNAYFDSILLCCSLISRISLTINSIDKETKSIKVQEYMKEILIIKSTLEFNIKNIYFIIIQNNNLSKNKQQNLIERTNNAYKFLINHIDNCIYMINTLN